MALQQVQIVIDTSFIYARHFNFICLCKARVSRSPSGCRTRLGATGSTTSSSSCTYTLHPAPYTLHHTPYTLYPRPFTLKNTPYTLHPAPCTMHSTPYTLHPTPYTIHPTPHAQHPTPYTPHPASQDHVANIGEMIEEMEGRVQGYLAHKKQPHPRTLR